MDRNAIGDAIWAALVGPAHVAPLGTFVLAAVAVLAFWQKWKADRKQEWWTRAQWAIDLALESDSQKQATGLQAMEAISVAPGGDKVDTDLLYSIHQAQAKRIP